MSDSVYLVKRAEDIAALGDTLRAACDTLFIDSLEGILDTDSRPMNNAQAVALLARIYPGPVTGNAGQAHGGDGERDRQSIRCTRA